MADIGSLVIKLAADTAEFQADLGRSARLLDKHASDMKASLQQVAGVARTAFAVVIGTTSVAALRDFVTQTLETSAALQGLAEQTGASATALSGFAPVATISGTAMDAIGGSLAKLSKGLAGVNDETAGATKALQFLGVRAKDASGNLRDPAEVMNDVALKLSEFEDGAGKTALAIELFGKSGASMLPFLKDLAENQDLNIRLTAQQIEEADNASKALARMKAETGFVAQTLVTAAIPSMTVLAQELKQVLFGTDDAVGGIQRLRTDGSLTTWAQNTAYAIAVVIDALRGIGQTIKSVIGSFQAVWADIELAGTFLAGGEGLNPFSEENRARLKAALDKRNAIVEQANQNYVELWDMPLLTDAVTKRFDDIRKGSDASNSETTAPTPRKRLNYSIATTAVTATAMAGIDSELKRLQGLVDAESGILKDRQRIIDLYENQGYLSFKEASDARLAAQQDFTQKLSALSSDEEAVLRKGLDTVAKTSQDKLKLQDKLLEIALKRQKLERDAQQSDLERQIRLPGESLKDLQEQASRGQAQLRASEEQIKTLRETGAISELDSLHRLGEARQESANQLATLAEQARGLADAAPGNEKLAEALRKIEEAARQAADGAQLLTQRAKELSDPEAGFAKGMRAVAEEAEQIGKQMEAATIRAFNGMTDALVGFVMTGKLDFRSLANSIISDLIRIQIQRAITLPLAKAMSSFFGFADGGVMTAEGPLPLRGYASGGIANSPQLAVFGEGSRPEAYVPLPDGRTIPVTMSGGTAGAMGAGHVFNISVSVSDAGAAARGDNAGGRDLGQAVANAVRQELLAQKRAGGLLDSRRAL
ncbi:phage tail tape measure C-terminal domain-containing protein [Limnohabitans lacus]|uniref:Phage tail tape measure C-terminal domain-containing protein n=1 Tax=Limnohabitans lacus TaxID=3045173 RepID=A0ABT6X9T6_9BURK|nr:phage tail tape measure C-terminal domain-containing protein [Limnohabitans sp. HM2-2]MDI9234724.1 phage tail tape measure C-terminal domain-containing protein [Limnohabitans sp. HM2-2]